MDSRVRFRNRRFAMKLADILPLETRSLATEPIQIALSFTGLTALSLLPSIRQNQSQEPEAESTAWNPIASHATDSTARTPSASVMTGEGSANPVSYTMTPSQSGVRRVGTDSTIAPELDETPPWVPYEPGRNPGVSGAMPGGGGGGSYVPPMAKPTGSDPFGSVGIDTGVSAPVVVAGSGNRSDIDPSIRNEPRSMGVPTGISPGMPGQVSLTPAYDPSTSKRAVKGFDPKMASAMESFSNFPLYTLDYNNGVVLFPGAYQYATLDGYVDLRAQAKDAVGVTYSWNTSGLTDAQNITGTSSHRLQFQWKSSSSGGTNTVTLTATDASNHQEVQTYTFLVPAGSVTPSGSSPSYSWPSVVTPDLALADTPSFVSHNLAVDAYSGAVDTAFSLPSYNSKVPSLVFSYDSVNADPRPLILSHHVLDPAQSVPTKVGAQLTFDGTAGTTYYYDTSDFTAGDFLQVALQADATSLSTGRYDYTVTMSDVRGSTTTTNVNGTMTVLNGGSSPFGAGWNLHGLEKITAATGGLIVDLGGGNKSLWYTGSGTGTYTSPAGEFSTLVKNGDNTYTRTLTDGTAIYYDTSGRQTTVKDLNDRRMTYAYDGGGKLSTVTDPYGQVTTLTYDGNGKLSTVTDPASRVTTFTFSGSKMTGVTLPDTNAWTFSYDASARLTSVTDPRSKTVTVTFGGSGRVSSITRPDTTTETIVPYQVQGYDTSGTSMSPAPAVLLAEAVASHTDPNSHETTLRPDWRGHGQPNQATDADGNIASVNRDSNGLATVTIDRLNRISFAAYDSSGNVTKITNPDLTYQEYGYGSYSRVTSIRNERAKYTYPAYDGDGNLTSLTDAGGSITTLTYTGTGQVATARDARNNVTTYQYDSYDRLTTITFADSTTNLFVYDTKGNVVTVTNERGYSTTYAYDAVNRMTGMTDALGNRTTYVYDASGNLTVIQAPASRTVTYAYDAMDRVTTVTNALNYSSVLGYDSAGNQTSFTDPLSRTTTSVYDALNRRTAVVDPLGNRTTTVYDAEGQVTVVRDPLNRATTMTYNDRGWVTTVKDPLSNVTTYTYSDTGKVTRISDPSNGGANLVSITYDNLDRRQAVDDALGKRTTYAYDEVGNPLGVVDPLGNTATYIYDSRNRLATFTDPLDRSTVRTYDAAGNLLSLTNDQGNTTTYAYDAADRLTTITDALSGVTTLSYDAANRQTGLTDTIREIRRPTPTTRPIA